MGRWLKNSRNAAPLVWASAALLLVALTVSMGWLLHEMRARVQADGAQRVADFVHSSARAVNQSLQSVDLLLQGVQGLLQRSAAPLLQQEPQALKELLAQELAHSPLVAALALVREDGKLLVGVDVAGTRVAEDVPAAWLFSIFRSSARDHTLHIDVPVPQAGASSASGVLHVARYLNSPHAGEHYFVVAQLPTVRLVHLLQSTGASSRMEATLERTDGRALLKIYPEGALAPPAPALGREPPAAQVHEAPSRINGEPSWMAVRSLDYDSLRLTAALPQAGLLQAWSQMRELVLAGLALLCAAVLGGALLATRYMGSVQRAHQRHVASEAALNGVMDSIAAGFLQLDAAGRVVRWNQRYEEMFPWQLCCLVRGSSWNDVLSTVESGRSEALHDELVELRRMQQAWISGDPTVNELSTSVGLTLQISQCATPEGGWVITFEDITEIRLATAEIENLAFYDPLTGLPNRRLLLDRLSQAVHLAKRSGWLGALLFLDLNKFKALNDTQGHEMGDLLLQEVAERLRASIRVSDTVARLGGDEFVVMLCDLPMDQGAAAQLTQRVAEKIMNRLSDPFVLGSYIHRTTASVGVTLFGHELVAVSELIKQADIAMYQSKLRHSTSVCFFEPHMQEVLKARARTEVELRQAVTAGQFVLHYQPQYVASGAIDGIEALIRWQHPARGLLEPADFVQLINDSELTTDIGQWVLETACAQLAQWQQHPRLAGVHVAVNISARQFQQKDFVEQVLQALQGSGVAPSLLRLELTESLVLGDLDGAVFKMHALRAAGVRFSMDDFGTGQSSLSSLTRLPLSQLKIDRSFISQLGLRHADDLVIQTIIGMARNLGLTVIAEGVEQQAQIDMLARFGCDRFQGYFFSRPMPAEELQRFVEYMPAVQPAMLGAGIQPSAAHSVIAVPTASSAALPAAAAGSQPSAALDAPPSAA